MEILANVLWHTAAAATSLQLFLTLCDPRDGSPPGSPIPGILQARTLKWVAISFSSTWKWKVKVKSLQSCPTTNDPVDCSLPGSSVHGICQTRVLEWGAIAFSIWHTNKLQLRMYPRVKLLIKNRFMSRFSSYCQTVSQSYLNSYSHQQYTRVPVAPQTCQQLVLSVLIILIIPVDLQWCFITVLIWISIMRLSILCLLSFGYCFSWIVTPVLLWRDCSSLYLIVFFLTLCKRF